MTPLIAYEFDGTAERRFNGIPHSPKNMVLVTIVRHCSYSFNVLSVRGGLGRRDTGKIPGGPPGPVILIIIKMHKENKSREDRAAFFFFFPGRAGPLELPSPPLLSVPI